MNFRRKNKLDILSRTGIVLPYSLMFLFMVMSLDRVDMQDDVLFVPAVTDPLRELKRDVQVGFQRDCDAMDLQTAGFISESLGNIIDSTGLNHDFLRKFVPFAIAQMTFSNSALDRSPDSNVFPVVVREESIIDDKGGVRKMVKVPKTLLGVRFSRIGGSDDSRPSRVGVAIEIDGFDEKVECLYDSNGCLNVISRNFPAHSTLGYGYEGNALIFQAIMELLVGIAISVRSSVGIDENSEFSAPFRVLHTLRCNDNSDGSNQEAYSLIDDIIAKKSDVAVDSGYVSDELRQTLDRDPASDSAASDRFKAMDQLVSSEAFWNQLMMPKIAEAFENRVPQNDTVDLSASIDVGRDGNPFVISVDCGQVVFIGRGRDSKYTLNVRITMPELVGNQSALLDFNVVLPADGGNGTITFLNEQLPRAKTQATSGSLAPVFQTAIVSLKFYLEKQYGQSFDVVFHEKANMTPNWLLESRVLDRLNRANLSGDDVSDGVESAAVVADPHEVPVAVEQLGLPTSVFAKIRKGLEGLVSGIFRSRDLGEEMDVAPENITTASTPSTRGWTDESFPSVVIPVRGGQGENESYLEYLKRIG